MARTTERLRCGTWLGLMALGVGLVPSRAPSAQEIAADSASVRPSAEEPSASRPWYSGLAVDGFLSVSWGYNFNRPASSTNQLRVFDFDDNTFKLDVAELVVQRPVVQPGEAGFRADVAAGSSVPRVSSSAGLLRDSTGAGDLDLQQAFVSWIAPVGRGLRFDAGKFITHHGYEVIEGYDGYDDNVTRSFLFGYAIPFTHLGLRAGYAFGPRLSGLVMLVNGWDVARDNNRGKSGGAQLTVAPWSCFTVIASGMYGPERAQSDDPRALADLVVSWRLTDRASLGLNLDYATEKNAVRAGESAMWRGAAAYARLGVTSKLAFAVRAERFEDRDGARTGVAQTLDEITFTPEYRLAPRLLLRGDLRLDRSDKPVFEKRRNFVERQSTVTFDTVFIF